MATVEDLQAERDRIAAIRDSATDEVVKQILGREINMIDEMISKKGD